MRQRDSHDVVMKNGVPGPLRRAGATEITVSLVLCRAQRLPADTKLRWNFDAHQSRKVFSYLEHAQSYARSPMPPHEVRSMGCTISWFPLTPFILHCFSFLHFHHRYACLFMLQGQQGSTPSYRIMFLIFYTLLVYHILRRNHTIYRCGW